MFILKIAGLKENRLSQERINFMKISFFIKEIWFSYAINKQYSQLVLSSGQHS